MHAFQLAKRNLEPTADWLGYRVVFISWNLIMLPSTATSNASKYVW
jgi:hypothetical protein